MIPSILVRNSNYHWAKHFYLKLAKKKTWQNYISFSWIEASLVIDSFEIHQRRYVSKSRKMNWPSKFDFFIFFAQSYSGSKNFAFSCAVQSFILCRLLHLLSKTERMELSYPRVMLRTTSSKALHIISQLWKAEKRILRHSVYSATLYAFSKDRLCSLYMIPFLET